MKKFALLLFHTLYFTFSSQAQWGNLVSNTNRDLYATYFFDKQNGFTVGDSGTILKTNNKGLTWTTVNSGTNERLIDIHFTSLAKGFIVGSKGMFLKSTNGGNSWAVQSGFPNLSLNSIFFIKNSNTGFIVGDVGLIMKTTDGGNNWSTKNSGVVYSLSAVSFVNDTLGFAVGGGGTLLKTIDAGENWTIVNLGTTDILSDIIFTENNTGYIVGFNGKIFKTTDNGNSWQNQNSNITDWLSSIDCINDNICMAVGSNGASLKISDGINWMIQTTPTSVFLQDVKMTEEFTSYACGFGGAVLKTCPQIIFSSTMITKGTIQFNDSSKNYSQIKWYFGDGDSSSSPAPLHVFPDTFSTYTIKIFATNETDCTDSATINFVPNGGVELGMKNSEFRIYPNPFSEKAVISIEYLVFSNEELQFTMYDLLGREVHHQILNTKHSELNTNLPDGIYFYQINNGKENIAKGKIVKQD